MTPAQVAHIMALVEEYAGDYARATTENLYGTSKSYTKQCFEAANESRAAVEAALRDAPQAEGWVMVPAKPTNEMVFEGAQCGEVLDYDLAARIYRAMLSARPSAPTAVEPDERAPHQDDPELTPAAFADRLARHMQIASLTAKEVSELTGVSETTLSRLKNHGRMPDAISYAALCNFMGWHPHIKRRLAARASKGTPK